MADVAANTQHIESHFRNLTRLTERYGAKSIGHALSGRRAANAAIAQGAKVILMSTLQNAPFVPLREDVTYLVYGDCTTQQLAALYGGKPVGVPGALINRRIQRLADHGVIFLCMSDWYRRALRTEFSIREEQLVLLPFYVDTDKWRPRDTPRAKKRAQVLFLGADLARKGGDIVYELAARPAFAHVDFHVVSPDATPGSDNLIPHRSLRADTDELRALVRSCDVLLLPTRADTSSLAALEAAACGLPAIITGLGGIPEIVLDGVTGTVLATAEVETSAAALSAYLSNPALITAHGGAARLRVERIFSKSRHFETLRRVIAKAESERAAGVKRAASRASTLYQEPPKALPGKSEESLLFRQTATYLVANIFSAMFGFLNVVVFTRMFAVNAYGDYLLGLGYATLLATFLGAALKLAILREQSRDDGTDIRPTVLFGLVLCAFSWPAAALVAWMAHLDIALTLAATGVAVAIVIFEASQEILRARQKAFAYMASTMTRAVLVSGLGIAATTVSDRGAILLMASAVGTLLAALAFWRMAWEGARPRVDGAHLRRILVSGFPMALSLSILALSGIADRFLIAHIAGTAEAGRFGASLDLVRQSLMIPAVSAASAFMPIAIQSLATKGGAAAREHLAKCFELLLSLSLPACVGFALVSRDIADLVLGPAFRETAYQALPLLSIAVFFQILTQQYVHTSFLLSHRNIFYLINTTSALAFNVIAALTLIPHFGVSGAVWGRVLSETFGFAGAIWLSFRAFPLPFAWSKTWRVGAAVAAMALPVWCLELALRPFGPVALLILIPVAIFVYVAACWQLDILSLRLSLAKLWSRHARGAASRGSRWRMGFERQG